MNNSQPTEPAGGQPDEAPPSERWIGAESARAAAPGSAGVPEPEDVPDPDGVSEPAADAIVAKPARARLAGALGLDAVRIRAALRIAGTRVPSDQDGTDHEPPSGERGHSQRSHLRLVPPSEPQALPQAEILPEGEPEPPLEPAQQQEVAPQLEVARTAVPTHPVPPNLPAPVPGSAAVAVPDLAPQVLPDPPRQPVRIFSELCTLAGIVLIGTAAALGVDAVIGGLNGLPPAYLLVFLASPIWDLLPGRLPARLAVIALDTAATIGVWFLLAAVPMQHWLDIQRGYWRAEFAFGLACLLVGALHLIIASVLNPQRPQQHPRRRAVP